MINTRGQHPFHIYGAILADISKILQRQWVVQVTHVLREANSSADVLAKIGTEQQDVLKLWHDPPNDVLPSLLSDRLGVILTRL